MQFFREENHRVVVDLEIKTVKEFRELIAKDKDRNKREATMWFSYLYFMVDYRSPFIIYPEEERTQRVCKMLDVDPLSAWAKPVRDAYADAKAAYLEMRETATVKSLNSIKQGLMSSSRVIDMLTNNINDKLVEGDIEPEDIDIVVKNVTKLLELSEKLPKAINTVKSLEEAVKTEQANDSKIRGGGAAGAFEN